MEGLENELHKIVESLEWKDTYADEIPSNMEWVAQELQDLRDILFVALLDTEEKKNAYEKIRESRKQARDDDYKKFLESRKRPRD